MLRRLCLALAGLTFLPIVIAGMKTQLRGSTIYWPVLSPSPTRPWVMGEANLLSWECATDTGIESFSIELHNHDHGVMEGFVKLARLVPMKRTKYGYSNYGGSMEIDLGTDVPLGDGFVIAFKEWVHGRVYAISEPFAIVAPDNSSAADVAKTTVLPTVTVTLDSHLNPTQEWGTTMDGKPLPTEAA